MKKPLLIAVTGGIGSGKTEVINRLKNLGEKVISCDQITLQLYSKRSVIKKLKVLFPQAVYGKFIKKIDKKIVANLVFNDSLKLKQLTDFLTPLVLETCLKQARRLRGRVFIEVPLLFECNAQDRFDKVIVVTRSLDSRINGIVNRSNLTKEQAMARINSQFNYDLADLSNYIVLQNDKDISHLHTKVDYLLNII